MTAKQLLLHLRSREFAVTLDKNKLVVSPGSKLTARDVGNIKRCRDELMDLVGEEELVKGGYDLIDWDSPEIKQPPVAVVTLSDDAPPVAMRLSDWERLVAGVTKANQEAQAATVTAPSTLALATQPTKKRSKKRA